MGGASGVGLGEARGEASGYRHRQEGQTSCPRNVHRSAMLAAVTVQEWKIGTRAWSSSPAELIEVVGVIRGRMEEMATRLEAERREALEEELRQAQAFMDVEAKDDWAIERLKRDIADQDRQIRVRWFAEAKDAEDNTFKLTTEDPEDFIAEVLRVTAVKSLAISAIIAKRSSFTSEAASSCTLRLSQYGGATFTSEGPRSDWSLATKAELEDLLARHEPSWAWLTTRTTNVIVVGICLGSSIWLVVLAVQAADRNLAGPMLITGAVVFPAIVHAYGSERLWPRFEVLPVGHRPLRLRGLAILLGAIGVVTGVGGMVLSALGL